MGTGGGRLVRDCYTMILEFKVEFSNRLVELMIFNKRGKGESKLGH